LTPAPVAGIIASSLLERIKVVTWDAKDREKYGSTYAEWSPERQAHNLEWQKARRDAKAIAEGREPGRIGRPARLTPEEKAANKRAQNKKRSKRALARRTAARAIIAIAKGREPGKSGGVRVLSDEERIAHRRANFVKSKNTDLEKFRAEDARRARERTAARAIAEGRVPGIHGALARLIVAELEDYLRKWPDPSNVFHMRLKAQNSRAKRLGVPGILTLVDIYDVLAEQAGICAFCAKPFGDEIPEIDHWEPMARGGHNTRENTKLLHMSCNRTKGAKLPSDLTLTSPLTG
jgi:5-methylcytosine-specific restriction endonuclease McrA